MSRLQDSADIAKSGLQGFEPRQPSLRRRQVPAAGILVMVTVSAVLWIGLAGAVRYVVTALF